MGILDVVRERRQWVQVILALSQQACCGDEKHEKVPHREGQQGARGTSGEGRGESQGQVCKTLRFYSQTQTLRIQTLSLAMKALTAPWPCVPSLTLSCSPVSPIMASWLLLGAFALNFP